MNLFYWKHIIKSYNNHNLSSFFVFAQTLHGKIKFMDNAITFNIRNLFFFFSEISRVAVPSWSVEILLWRRRNSTDPTNSLIEGFWIIYFARLSPVSVCAHKRMWPFLSVCRLPGKCQLIRTISQDQGKKRF